jgi:hypothetical protein
MISGLFFASLDPVRQVPELYTVHPSTLHDSATPFILRQPIESRIKASIGRVSGGEAGLNSVSNKSIFKTQLSLALQKIVFHGGYYYAWHYDAARNQGSGRY